MKLNRKKSLKLVGLHTTNCACRCSFCRDQIHCGSKENGCRC